VQRRLACSACESIQVQSARFEDYGGVLKTQLEVACEPYNTLLHAEQQEHGKTSTH